MKQSRCPFNALSRERVAFSLLEVVMSLAIFSFVAVALIGLVSVGINTNRESAEALAAANIMQSSFAARRAAPVTPDLPRCALPHLDESAVVPPSSPLFLREDGSVTEIRAESRFALVYTVSPPDSTRRFATVHVCLFWPAQSPLGKEQGRYEMTGSFLLP